MKKIKDKIYTVIFEHDTKAGKYFDIILILFVFLSVLVVALETVEGIRIKNPQFFIKLEWFFTIVFTVELLLRLFSVKNKIGYIFSFFGVIDIVSIMPTYLALFLPAAQTFLIVRALRMLRIFRILKLNQYTSAGLNLKKALRNALPKIVVFLGTVVTLVIIIGALIYFIEGKTNGFTSIPKSIYWAIVTLTTVGYGDITPQTPLGQIISSAVMILGYSIIAVPTGIMSVEMGKIDSERKVKCPNCNTKIKI
jgi:voltage-gated potassium channel